MATKVKGRDLMILCQPFFPLFICMLNKHVKEELGKTE